VDLSLSDEQRAVREAFAALFRKESTPDRVRLAEPVGFDAQLWQRYCDMGALSMGVPAECGGADGGLQDMALVAEEAGRRLAAIPVAEPMAAARVLARLGEKDLLMPVLGGATIVSVAAGPGQPSAQWLVDGAVADAVVARTADTLCYVRRPAGLPTRPRPNLGGLPMARWDVTAQSAPLADGPLARQVFETALDEIRVLRAAALVGLASEAVDIGAKYATTREAFGQPIAMYQAVAHPFADALAALDGAALLVSKACWALDTDHPDGPTLASMAFVFAAETAYQAAGHSLHVHGGYGFMSEYDIQLYYRRAKAWSAAFADPRRELLTVADRRFGPVAAKGQ
jgi:alkylation response protein AidB-like acyl-CoA dehydrogenase